ncbi:hypothetical protein VP01_3944g1 [Puccinia sorghi]|uniref:Uncharacterized protein n=1 Tax=Puccinia sorghi TaxID=27349 RepID=A0A0L6UTA9_9BASI|nr:hypothetical protein VP01_3944g1 [Puccinia sorghi]
MTFERIFYIINDILHQDGNFQAPSTATLMEKMCLAIANISKIMFAQVNK